MPRGPKGEKRPADVIGNAVKVMRIATGEETETLVDADKNAAAVAFGSVARDGGWHQSDPLEHDGPCRDGGRDRPEGWQARPLQKATGRNFN
jgi:hypothetical protein